MKIGGLQTRNRLPLPVGDNHIYPHAPYRLLQDDCWVLGGVRLRLRLLSGQNIR
jgi:hypothetical protein